MGRRWNVNYKENSMYTQGPEKVMKLEKEKAIIKDICRARCRQVKDLEDKVRELEGTQTTSFTKRIEFLQQRTSTPRYTTTMHFNKHLDFEKNGKP